jgi:probable HAF family extracellular repeat protein
VIQALPTFSGGHNGFATGINNSGQVVGWAENGVQDASCNDPQKLQFRAALWESKGRSMSITELSPLGADETSAATAINERGNVVGISGECDVAVGNLSAKHSVLWQKGKAVQIPDFGGIAWNTPMAVNVKNEVVGFANKAGTTTSDYDAVAFYWSKSAGLVEIGILPGDTNSQAHGINSEGVTVGVSFGGAIGSRAFVWRRGGEITDLNTLVVGGEPGVLVDARDINERGEITGGARDASGKSVAFIARPVFEEED